MFAAFLPRGHSSVSKCFSGKRVVQGASHSLGFGGQTDLLFQAVYTPSALFRATLIIGCISLRT